VYLLREGLDENVALSDCFVWSMEILSTVFERRNREGGIDLGLPDADGIWGRAGAEAGDGNCNEPEV
jgi:hypothetical protein